MTNECFHRKGNFRVRRDKLKMLDKTGNISGEDKRNCYSVILSVPELVVDAMLASATAMSLAVTGTKENDELHRLTSSVKSADQFVALLILPLMTKIHL